MKKKDLLKRIDDELIDKLYGFCYARTNDSYEAEELCSDILYAILKNAAKEGEIHEIYGYIWRIARNVYADFSAKRRREADTRCSDDPEEVFRTLPAEESEEDDSEELLRAVYLRISYLTRAYREVMIAFYLDGKSTAQIAGEQGISETAVRQRLFQARKNVKQEVDQMKEMNTKPTALSNVEFTIWGTGNPGWGDPRDGFDRQFSKHILKLCMKKPRTASELAEELGVPTVYVEEELEIMCRGANGEYGLLRRLENGRYGVNLVLFDKEAVEEAHALYCEQIPNISKVIADFVEANREEYLAFPYINKKVDMNLILWQQISRIASYFSNNVSRILDEKFFKDEKKPDRPFSVFGYEDNGKTYGGGWDGIYALNICGFTEVHCDNIYIARIRPHFHCGHNISNDPQLQLALQAIDGVDINKLSEEQKEHAAKAMEQGYLYREGDMLYTKLLTVEQKDRNRLFEISDRLWKGYFDKEAEAVAEKMAALIRKHIPEYLHGEWRFANSVANMPVLDAVVEALIERGILTPPENGVGAEGCWMIVQK